MTYRFQATETFWKKFYMLPRQQKAAVRRTWALVQQNPFDPRLGTHWIKGWFPHRTGFAGNGYVFGG